MEALAAHPHAQAVLGPVVEGSVAPTHAWLFHGPPGCGRAEVAEAIATSLLSRGSERDDTAARVVGRTHPDLMWVKPEGANGEILVDDIREVVSSVPLTPFEARCRVFVIEGADRMNESSANAFLKTLEEPPAHAHLILIADATTTVLPTILSRCQSVRFEPPSPEALAARLEREGVEATTARECAQLASGDGAKARMLAGEHGAAIRSAGEQLARAAVKGGAATAKPWLDLLKTASEEGKSAAAQVEQAAEERLQFAAKTEKKRVEKDAEERGKRAGRRAESAAADLGLFVAEAWLRDLHRVVVGAGDTLPQGRSDSLSQEAASVSPAALRDAIDRIEATRGALKLNVNRELAIESLAHELDGVLS